MVNSSTTRDRLKDSFPEKFRDLEQRLREEDLHPDDFPKPKNLNDHINGISEHEKEHLTKENMQLPEGTERELPAYRKEKVERIKNAE